MMLPSRGAASAPPAFVLQLNRNDVLLGRGIPSNENEGNVRFRELVQRRKHEYVSTTIRQRKDAIAREIMDEVARRQGRFVRKIDSIAEAEALGVPRGVVAWAPVDEEKALLKVKQALRGRETRSVASPETNEEDTTSRSQSKPLRPTSSMGSQAPRSQQSGSNQDPLQGLEARRIDLPRAEMTLQVQPPNVFGPSPSSQLRTGLSCNLVEALILTVLCSRGLPLITGHVAEQVPNVNSRFHITWPDILFSLLSLARSHYPISFIRNNMGDGNVWNAVVVAKKALMLIEKMRRIVRDEQTRTDIQDIPVENEASLSRWFEQEIKKWASILGTTGPNDRPLALSTTDLITPLSLDTSTPNIGMAYFSYEECEMIVSQVECISRVRSIFSLSMVGLKERLLRSLATSADASSGPGDAVNNISFLERLLLNGYESILPFHRTEQIAVRGQEVQNFRGCADAHNQIQYLALLLHQRFVAREER